MKLKDYIIACKHLLITVENLHDPEVTGICNDTRMLKAGDIFVAIEGTQVDGRNYINDAVAKGACAIVSKRCDSNISVPHLIVSDDYAAYSCMAEAFFDYPVKKLKSIAVTGTNGKTTTSYLTQHILKAAGYKPALIGTISYLVCEDARPSDRTTPDAMLVQSLFADAVDRGCDSVVMEISSHALHQRRMGTTKFNRAVFTNLTPEHLDYHITMKAYYEAKKRLFTDYLADNGQAIVNKDCRYGKYLLDEIDAVSFSIQESADIDGRHYLSDLSGTEILLNGTRYRTHLVGAYNVANTIAAIGIAKSFAISDDIIQQALFTFPGVPGRLQAVPNKISTHIFIDYAHSSDAIENVLRAIKPLCEKRLICLFGCGGDRDKSKRPLMGRSACHYADKVYISSDNPRTEDPQRIIDDILEGIDGAKNVEIEIDRHRAIEKALFELKTGDTLLVLGKGHEDFQEIDGQKLKFNDFEECREYLEKY
ncbi:MAG: UDP-N-acetylmuramoyl-L-alanyl-D-glutamate--2,6-diaminopimelate ligase [Lentisphaeria bacterium]|nr:UDP-N-acetylmuramoyl-L-alanyl-D-glutamate--2,6-diaminopimelate ligase [Lentisphaeria bacterium]NQZ68458.1 UDP-N-acetylmuramoyl-L-alanyl-D-glutamate--2,6-diaminopimelate ligase [Lentisphaeria bacterium]